MGTLKLSFSNLHFFFYKSGYFAEDVPKTLRLLYEVGPFKGLKIPVLLQPVLDTWISTCSEGLGTFFMQKSSMQ